METDDLQIKIRMKGELGEIFLEVPKVFVAYYSESKRTEEVIDQAVKLYKGLYRD